jgi:hypothetical protein
VSSVSPAVRWSRRRESNSDAPKRTGSQPVAYAVSAMSGECTGRASNPQCPKAHASEACVFAGFTTCASSEARGSNPAKRACRARVVTSSLASAGPSAESRTSRSEVPSIPRRSRGAQATRSQRVSGVAARPVHPLGWCEARGSNSAWTVCGTAGVTRRSRLAWSGRLESHRAKLGPEHPLAQPRSAGHQHGPAPEAGGQPLSHARIGSPPWIRTTISSLQRRASMPLDQRGRRCRRSESNALVRAYGTHAVPNVVGVAGPALAAGDLLVMSQARRAISPCRRRSRQDSNLNMHASEARCRSNGESSCSPRR